MTTVALVLLGLPVTALGYAYLVYPAALWCVTRLRRPDERRVDRGEWPSITITMPVYNEARIIRSSLEHVLGLDYPADRRHVLVISDASTDGTDAIVAGFADRGVSLVRLPTRAGKTAAENAAAAHLLGEIVVNVDATARPGRGALKSLIAAFADPKVGVASGRDVSTGAEAEQTSAGESGYVGYEMWVRSLETRVDSIVGSSGCFYAIRRSIYEEGFPDALSRDFASALIAREHGLRAVSVDEAVCAVPRAKSLDVEFRRKVRTMHRGLETLWYKRQLLDPRKYGRFAVMLFSHKVCRWLVPLTLPFGLIGVAMLALTWDVAAWAVGIGAAGLAISAVAVRWPDSSRVRRALALPSYLLMANAAGIVAWWEAFRREREAMWEPTRRPV
jgi:cellulose synthase/poly-beta-1,6-N-acetylglucosamine synthase-like glycosyltransferase